MIAHSLPPHRNHSKKGSGLINSAINSLPFELHIPGGYQYCGPGTKLQKRLARGDPGINPLDIACRQHDIAYAQHKDLKDRHEADRILQEKAWQRVRTKDASVGEKAAAWLVTTAMKAKRKLGMGCNNKRKKVVKKRPPPPHPRTRTLKTGGFLPVAALLPLIGKALLAGVASGAASYGTKKALGAGLYLRPHPQKRGGGCSGGGGGGGKKKKKLPKKRKI